MCDIETWSTRYCLRTVEKVWRSKMKKIWFAECQKNDTRQRSLFAECQDKTLGKGASLPSVRTYDTRQKNFLKKNENPSLPSARPGGTRQRIKK